MGDDYRQTGPMEIKFTPGTFDVLWFLGVKYETEGVVTNAGLGYYARKFRTYSSRNYIIHLSSGHTITNGFTSTARTEKAIKIMSGLFNWSGPLGLEKEAQRVLWDKVHNEVYLFLERDMKCLDCQHEPHEPGSCRLWAFGCECWASKDIEGCNS